jgi:hypothetical protein
MSQEMPLRRKIPRAAHTFVVLAGAVCGTLIAGPASTQVSVLNCKPYVHGELRKNSATFFCTEKKHATDYLDILDGRRLESIDSEEAGRRIAKLRNKSDCYYIAVTHKSRITLRQGTEPSEYCKDLGFGATRWPSLVEAELTGDGATIWVITNAIVPPPPGPRVKRN